VGAKNTVSEGYWNGSELWLLCWSLWGIKKPKMLNVLGDVGHSGWALSFVCC